MKGISPKECRIHVRVTHEQAAKLERLCSVSRQSQSELFRRFLDGLKEVKPAPVTRPIFDMKTLAELNKQGYNINQIARELNAGDRDTVTKEEFAALDRALLQVIALVLLGEAEAKRLAQVGLTDFAPYIPVLPAKSPRSSCTST